VARRAILVYDATFGVHEDRLGRILDFFGVPWQALAIGEPVTTDEEDRPYAVLGDVTALAAALCHKVSGRLVREATATYGYTSSDANAAWQALSDLAGGQWSCRSGGNAAAEIEVAAEVRDVTGPMTALHLKASIAPEDCVLVRSDGGPDEKAISPLIFVDGAHAFFRIAQPGGWMYICGAGVVDIDAPVSRNHYDVKTDFLRAVPLVMFITASFAAVMWRPQEIGACLIIDDPLLKSRYGFCDFRRLRDLMRQYRFTTNIAFIPWNWRRTTRRGAEFFRRESNTFSVSVHGCDHIAGEFGSSSPDVIARQARLAQSRMHQHLHRTRVEHDPVMVFPQGMFSSVCPGILKRNGFMAAVNTEIAPVDANTRTLIRDAWATAILRYGSFAIFTRRYAHHGIENFAFDMLLGKPCFIVAHHEFFRDGGTAAVTLVEKLAACTDRLRWRSPREVIRRAYRTRFRDGVTEVQMFGAEVLLTNSTTSSQQFRVRKLENDPTAVVRVSENQADANWHVNADGLHVQSIVPAAAQSLLTVTYDSELPARSARLSPKYELTVAARRILSEFRDEYVHKLPAFLGLSNPIDTNVMVAPDGADV
jgi:hypothetical protein